MSDISVPTGWSGNEAEGYKIAVLADGPVGYWRLNDIPSYAETIFGDEPVSYWRLNEAVSSPTVQDSITGTPPATVIGTPTFQVTGALKATTNKAVTLNGTTDLIVVDYSPIHAPTAALTLECWAYMADWGTLDATTRFFSKTNETVGDGGYRFGTGGPYTDPLLQNTPFIYFYVFVTGGVVNVSNPYARIHAETLSPGWHHFIGTFDGRYAKMYVDGVLRDTGDQFGSTTTIAYASTNSLIIGGELSGVTYLRWWAGSLDECAVYSTALTANQIATHYTVGVTSVVERHTDMTVSKYHVLADSSPHNHPGTQWGSVMFQQIGALQDVDDKCCFFDSGFSGPPGGPFVRTNRGVGLIPHDTSLTPTDAVTVECWAEHDNWASLASSRQVLVSKTQGGGYELVAGYTVAPLGNANNITAIVHDGTAYMAAGYPLSSLAAGWHHFVSTYDSRYLKLYVDGVLQATYDAGVTTPIGYGANVNLVLAGEALGSIWFRSGWRYRQAITIDPSKVGAGGVTDFPVLINHTDTNLQDYAQANGNDILFTSSNGTTKLSHEIESYANGALIAWVKVPSISSSVPTILYMYYGNPLAANQQDVANVWESNFKGVWHMSEGTGVTAVDSTVNGNSGVPTGAPTPTTATGKINKALTFPAGVGRLQMAADASLNLTSTVNPNWTMSAWVYPTSFTGTNYLTIYTFGLYRAGMDLSQATAGTDGRLEIWTNDAGARLSDLAAPLNQWTHVAVARDATNTVLYVNGVGVSRLTPAAVTGGVLISEIGGANGTATNEFIGSIDEVHVATVVRSAAWITTEYNNQNSPSTFLSVGAQVVEEEDTVIPGFKGSLDEVAVYPTALDATRVAYHYARRSIVPDSILYDKINEPPVPNDLNWISSPDVSDGRLSIQLRQNNVLIAERVITPTADLETYTMTLTTEEKNAVTDWRNLAVWFDVYVLNQIAKVALDPINPPDVGDVTLLVRTRSVTH